MAIVLGATGGAADTVPGAVGGNIPNLAAFFVG